MFKDRSNFSYKPEAYFKEKIICITGKIKEYNRKAEIIFDKEEQATIQQNLSTLHVLTNFLLTGAFLTKRVLTHDLLTIGMLKTIKSYPNESSHS